MKLKLDLEIMTLVLVILKLTGVISVSWWLVFAPTWVPMAIFFAIWLFIILTP